MRQSVFSVIGVKQLTNWAWVCCYSCHQHCHHGCWGQVGGPKVSVKRVAEQKIRVPCSHPVIRAWILLLRTRQFCQTAQVQVEVLVQLPIFASGPFYNQTCITQTNAIKSVFSVIGMKQLTSWTWVCCCCCWRCRRHWHHGCWGKVSRPRVLEKGVAEWLVRVPGGHPVNWAWILLLRACQVRQTARVQFEGLVQLPVSCLDVVLLERGRSGSLDFKISQIKSRFTLCVVVLYYSCRPR